MPLRNIRLLIVDDSLFVRQALTRKLAQDTEIEIVGYASDGLEAIAQAKALSPDVITLDVEMPRMNGLDALAKIMAERPTPVVMLSSLTGEGAQVTMQALEAGAVDFYLKNSISAITGGDLAAADLRAKIKHAASINRSRLRPITHAAALQPPSRRRAPASGPFDHVIVIGSSTGGPRALMDLIPSIPGDINAAILIVQHMPAGFTRSLAQRLDTASQVQVKEAEAGDRLQRGLALLAPGGHHMIVTPQGAIELTQSPPENGVRPAVEPTMTAAAAWGPRAIGVILTGMGNDGTRGARAMRAAGGRILVEDESTAVVYGMPRSVAEAGLADLQVPLHRICHAIVQFLSQPAAALRR